MRELHCEHWFPVFTGYRDRNINPLMGTFSAHLRECIYYDHYQNRTNNRRTINVLIFILKKKKQVIKYAKDSMPGSQVVTLSTQIFQLMLTTFHNHGSKRLQAVSLEISRHISEWSTSPQISSAKWVNMQRILLMMKCNFLSYFNEF